MQKMSKYFKGIRIDQSDNFLVVNLIINNFLTSFLDNFDRFWCRKSSHKPVMT